MRQKAFIRLSFEKDKRGLLVRPARAFVNGTVKNRRHHPVSPPSPLHRPAIAAIAAPPSPPSPPRHRTICASAAFLRSWQLPCPLQNREKTCRLTICVAVTFLMARQLPCPLPNRGKTCHRTICASAAFLTSWRYPARSKTGKKHAVRVAK